MAISFSEIMGMPAAAPDPTMQKALILMLLRSILENEAPETGQDRGIHPMPQEPELRVRPRIEPMGGS